MKHFQRLQEGIETAAALQQIEAHPALWGEHPERTGPGSPHAQSQDIWLRFRSLAELTQPSRFAEPHFAEFYPAWHALPALHPIVFNVMRLASAVYLGGILLTRIPPGGRILPHTDAGWHATFLNTKAYAILKANEGCLNHCGGETVVMRPGEAWRFENLTEHSVENLGDADRIALIITMRTI